MQRRTFLKAAAVAGVSILPRHVLGGKGFVAPSDRVNVALVGAGGRGLQNARELMKLDDVQITAVADPANHWDLENYYYKGVAGRDPVIAEIEKHYRQANEKFSCKPHEDYREMISEQADEFDAVLCATPDHLHALVSLAAMRAGKHVYCEKPLTHNIAEARLVAKVAKETGVATQMGNQGHSEEGIRKTCEMIWEGAIGTVQEVHAWVPASRWNPGMTGIPKEAEPIPAGVNWDLWCGPRNPPVYHSAFAPVAWRDFWMFGCGAMGDFGCHDLDSAVWALNLQTPSRVELRPAGQMNADIAPYGEIGYFDFPQTEKSSAVKLTWYSGGLTPPRPDLFPNDAWFPNRGVLFVGSEGIMVCQGAGGDVQLFPESRREKFGEPGKILKRSNGHHRDWIDAAKGGAAASSNFEYGAKLTEITLLGLVALQTGKVIHWDHDKMVATGVAEADPIINGQYRDGWKLA